MKDPFVSIIIPVYNVAKYLSKCIESIMKQIEQNWELILIDDGSDDGSSNICDDYALKDVRIKVVHKCNEGVSVARNVGIKLAKGQYICFVDSDDWVEDDYLSSMLQYVQNEDTIVYGNLRHDYNNKLPDRIAFNYKDGDIVNEVNYGDAIVHYKILENGYPFSKLFRKAIIDKFDLRFDSSISYHEDHLFVLNYLIHTKQIILSARASYHYMHRGNVISLSKKKHPVQNMILASSKLIFIITTIINKYHFNNKEYIKHLYTILGLNQLIAAALGASKEDIYTIGKVIREKKKLFRMYYAPNHSYVKIIPILFFVHLDFVVVWIGKLVRGRLI